MPESIYERLPSTGLATLASLLLAGVIFAALALLRNFPVVTRLIHDTIHLLFLIVTWQPVLLGAAFCLGRSQSYLNTFINYIQTRGQSDRYILPLLILILFKSVKIFVHTISYYLYTRPTQLPPHPVLLPADVTVIVPTIGDFGDEFERCIISIIENKPYQVIISTVGLRNYRKAMESCLQIDPRVKVVFVAEADKRAQLVHALKEVKTPITSYADDHVFWPKTFLRSSLATFDDPLVGLVGTAKRVERTINQNWLYDFFNYLACIYLARHNFEFTATYNIDGGVSVISGRTVLLRTDIIQSIKYREGFLNDTWLWGLVGPLKVDDDNFNTRFMVNHGYKTVFHNHKDAIVETSLCGNGEINKFRGQLLRWARTTWRSNSSSLFADRVCWHSVPWTTYAMFISSFINFALIYDGLMFYFHHKSQIGHGLLFFTLLFISKIIKPLPHLLQEPKDLKYLPFGILFGYLHSGIKFWALLTCWNIEWSGRQGIKPSSG